MQPLPSPSWSIVGPAIRRAIPLVSIAIVAMLAKPTPPPEITEVELLDASCAVERLDEARLADQLTTAPSLAELRSIDE
jgi:hypothetical protein